MQKRFLIIVLIIVFGSQVQAQNVSKAGTSAAPFLNIPVGARAVGMGGAYVSVVNDATALYWNASGIAALQKREVVFIHSKWLAETSFDFAAVILPLGRYGTIGLSITSLSMDDMKVRTEDKPEGTGEYFSAGDITAGLSYAYKLTDRFAIGFTGKYIQQTIWHMKASAMAVDMGTTFRTDLFNGMIIGASISNFGTSMRLAGRDTRQFNRVDETIQGSNERIPMNIEMDSWDLPLFLQIGVSTNAFKTDEARCTVALDAIHPNNNHESLNAGIELAYKERFLLRSGYRALFLKEAEGGLSYGFGMKTDMLPNRSFVKFDYAFLDMGRLEEVHLFSISVGF